MNSRKRDQPLATRLTLPAPEWIAAPPDQILISLIAFPESQPRRYFDPATLAALSESIRTDGVLQPILGMN